MGQGENGDDSMREIYMEQGENGDDSIGEIIWGRERMEWLS